MSIESQLGDLHQLITADGNTLTIPDGIEIVFKGYGGYGAPPVEWITRRGYKQHGVTEIDFNLSPRTINVQLFQNQACDRETYWANRAELHNFLRHNRGGKLTFVLKQAGGAKRALMVRANPGAVFAPQVDNNSWVIDEPIDLIAFDPIWFDPDTVTAQISLTVDSSLIFPITFPITFGRNGAQFNYLITYTGTWQSYPTLTLNGPYTSAIITNTATGKQIGMVQGCIEGDSRIITLTPGEQSVTDAAGNNMFSDLAPNANLVEFAIQPDPIVPDGIQTITAVLQGARVYMGTGWLVQSQIFAPNRWYRLNDSTTTVIDSGSDNASGVLQGGYTQGVAGALLPNDTNTATTFNGTTGTALVPPINVQNISYTISGFIKVASLAANPLLFGGDGGGGGAYSELALGATAAGAVIAYFGGGVTFSSSNGLVSTGAYQFLTLTFSHATGQLHGFLNGVRVINTTALDIAAASLTSYIGSLNASANFLNGQADEVELWLGRALTDDEVELLYASRLIASRTYSPSGFAVDYNNRYFAI